MAGAQRPANRIGGLFDVLHVRFTRGVQGCGDACDHTVRFRESGEVSSGFEPATIAEADDSLILDMADVGLAGIELLDLSRVDIETNDTEPDSTEAQNQRKTDITQADHADKGVMGFDFSDQFVSRHATNSRIFSMT